MNFVKTSLLLFLALFLLGGTALAQEEEVMTPELLVSVSDFFVPVGETFTVMMTVTDDVIEPDFYLGIGELILAEARYDGTIVLEGQIGSVEVVAAEVDPATSTATFTVLVASDEFGIALAPFVYGDILDANGNPTFISLPGNTVEVITVPQPVFTAGYDYFDWYSIAADIIGVSSYDLRNSDLSIKQIAKDNDIAPKDVRKAIRQAEKEILKEWRDEGLISRDTYRELRGDLRQAVKEFVKTPPAEFASPTVSEAQALWETNGFDSYIYTLKTSCYCYQLLDYRITVENGIVTNVDAFPAYGEEFEYDPNPDPSGFRTLDNWYTFVSDTQAQQPAYMSVSYDPIFGNLNRISIDYDIMIADEEVGYTITDFTPLP